MKDKVLYVQTWYTILTVQHIRMCCHSCAVSAKWVCEFPNYVQIQMWGSKVSHLSKTVIVLHNILEIRSCFVAMIAVKVFRPDRICVCSRMIDIIGNIQLRGPLCYCLIRTVGSCTKRVYWSQSISTQQVTRDHNWSFTIPRGKPWASIIIQFPCESPVISERKFCNLSGDT